MYISVFLNGISKKTAIVVISDWTNPQELTKLFNKHHCSGSSTL